MSFKSVGVWLIVIIGLSAGIYYFILPRWHAKKATELNMPSGNVSKVIVLDGDFKQAVLNQPGAVLVDFSASWCPMCNVMSPIFHTVSQLPEFSNVKFVSVDVDKFNTVATEYGVNAIPTFIFFKDGKQLESHIGGMEQDALVKKIKEVFKL